MVIFAKLLRALHVEKGRARGSCTAARRMENIVGGLLAAGGG
jgi:hypothetical protein